LVRSSSGGTLSGSFLKKRTKKLLIPGARAGRTTRLNNAKFFASFFQKRSASFLTCKSARVRACGGA
jgi:hypothetical protein